MECHLQKHEFMSWKNQRQTFEQGRKEVYFEARREGDAHNCNTRGDKPQPPEEENAPIVGIVESLNSRRTHLLKRRGHESQSLERTREGFQER
jgi:hypothetical protein